MNLREDDVVSAVALVMETNTAAQAQAEIAEGAEDTLDSVAGDADGSAPEAVADDTGDPDSDGDSPDPETEADDAEE
jgi:hypothetical protein